MLKLEKTNPYLLFLPFLLFYLLIVILFQDNILIGDEGRYLSFAANLCNGFFSPPFPNINLDNGPGYPLILAPFVKLGFSFQLMRLLNPVFLYFSVVYIFKICHLYLDFKRSLFFACFFACYYPFYQYLLILYTELISIFLLTLFIYFVHRYKNKRPTIKELVLPSVFLGYLALTKVIFGYFIILSIVVLALFYMFKRSIEIRRLLLIALLSFSACVPYLIYTYSLTGKVFYWGGNRDTFYWMTSPHKEELGDWNPRELRGNEILIKNHFTFFDSIQKLPYLCQNEAYTQKSMQNIKRHPERYVMNVFANVGRMFFNYPFSYNRHGNIWYADLAYMMINVFLVVPLFLLIIMFLLNLRRTPFAVGSLLLFILAYFGASILVSADKRMFFPLIPIIVTSLAFYLSWFKIERTN